MRGQRPGDAGSRPGRFDREKLISEARIEALRFGPGLLPAAATSASTSAAIPAISAPARIAPPFGLGLRHFDLDGSAVEVASVEMSDRVLRLLVRLHLDKTEAFRPTTELVGDDGCRDNRAGLGEELTKSVAGGVEAEAADEEFLRHGSHLQDFPLLRARLRSAEGTARRRLVRGARR